MSNEKEDFSLESILKKVQDGDTTLLIVAAILVIIPAIFLFFLVGDKTDKKMTQQKFRSMTQRRNVFNFTSKTEDGKTSAPKSSLPSASSNWFGGDTPEQRAQFELEEAARVLEKQAYEIEVPIELQGDARKQYLAENNYNLRLANSALDSDNFEEAEKYINKALEEAKDNDFLTLYALGSLCALFERTGDKKKLEEAYKLYIEAVSKIPPEYGGMDLKKSVRDVYQGLLVLGKHANDSEITEALSKEPLFQSGEVPSNINIRDVYKNFPIKYE